MAWVAPSPASAASWQLRFACAVVGAKYSLNVWLGNLRCIRMKWRIYGARQSALLSVGGGARRINSSSSVRSQPASAKAEMAISSLWRRRAFGVWWLESMWLHVSTTSRLMMPFHAAASKSSMLR